MKSVLIALETHVQKRFIYIVTAGALSSMYISDEHYIHAILVMALAFMDVE